MIYDATMPHSVTVYFDATRVPTCSQHGKLNPSLTEIGSGVTMLLAFLGQSRFPFDFLLEL